MPASEKQIAANRANAGKSTGPRTPRGKEKSSLNAVRHGLTAQSSVLPGEDPAQLEALSDSLMKQLKPRGMVQRLMAERIVSLAWKLRRVARAEEAVAGEMRSRGGETRFGQKHGEMDGADLLAESVRNPAQQGLFESLDTRLVRITEYELRLDAALRAAVRELLRLQKEPAAFEEVEEEPEAPAEVGGPAPEERDGEEDPGLRCAAPAACENQPLPIRLLTMNSSSPS